jgi:hypothetical protein
MKLFRNPIRNFFTDHPEVWGNLFKK